MKIEQKDGYTVIDRRGPEPCRVCACPDDCHTREYGKPTMECIKYLRDQQVTFNSVKQFLTNNKDQIAFSEPGPDGKVYALNYIVNIDEKKEQKPGLVFVLKGTR